MSSIARKLKKWKRLTSGGNDKEIPAKFDIFILMIRHTTPLYIIITTLLGLLFSCTNNEEVEIVGEAVPCKVAVVLPMNDGLDLHWHRTLQLCADNIGKATAYAGHGVNMTLEYYDEENRDIRSLADSLAKAGDITAVIGGLYSNNAKTLASRLILKDVPLFTMATTEQLVRGYASWGNLWAMTETDITQCEVLLSKAVMRGAKSVALIAMEGDAYCQTFIDWYAFQAEELGLTDCGLYTYTATDHSKMADAFESGADYVICVPAEIEDIAPMIEAQQAVERRTGRTVKTLYSDTAFGADVIARTGSLCEGLEGVTFGADPTTGFEVAYEVMFNEYSTLGEAQAYDACMLIGLATMVQQVYPDLKFKEAMRKLVSGRDMAIGGWMLEDMALITQSIAAGGWPDITGASSNLNFDAKVFTNVLSTVYYDYLIYNQQYVIIDFNSTDGSKRSDATLAGWNWRAKQMQDFDEDNDRTYPALDDRWALLVATSSGWENYRHQADVLNMYQILRQHGYTDDHIVLILEDDISQNKANPEPGIVRSRIGGENVRADAIIDYHTSELHPTDLTDILLGHKSDRLSEVIRADEDDNVLIFWSGHGSPAGLNWMHDQLVTHDDADALLTALEDAAAYRRLLWLVETCYSGGVADAASSHNGVLAITAANERETSKADVHDLQMDVWLSNRFTATLHDCLTADPSISLRDLYYRLFQNTVGSHVCVFGADGYGNLYKSSMGEFLMK